VDSDSILYQRLHNQHLWGPPLETPEGVVRWLAAMQSQEFAYARWSVAQRSGVTAGAVDRAFAGGAILRIHVIRPTWHFVAPADIRWILDISAPRVHALNAYYYRQTGVDASLAARTNGLFARSLEGGRQLTRKAMATVLQNAGISADGVKLAYLLMRAELDGVICSGAPRGKQHTYALFADRVPKAKTLDRDEALAELTRRYFASRGPATLKDYLGWSSLTATQGKAGLEMVKEELEREVVDGRTYWFAPASNHGRPRSPVIDLVQGYDEYVMSYSESRDLLFMPGRASARPLDRTAFYHAILLDGRLIGHWRHVLEKGKAVIETQLDRRLSASEKQALTVAIERYGEFLELPATLQA
jgi:winged helix DNA-binding protein